MISSWIAKMSLTDRSYRSAQTCEPSRASINCGFDYMFNPHWGLFFDAKKIFAQFDVKTRGINLGPPIGAIPAAASSRTTAEPWLLSSGATYRF